MAMISLQAMALQTAKTVSSRQIGDTLIQVYQLSEGEQQMAEAQAVLEHYGDLGQLQHCGYLL